MQAKDLPLLSRQFTLEELAFVGIYINPNNKIQPGAHILSLLPTLTMDVLERISLLPTLALLFSTNLSFGKPHFQRMETTTQTTAFLRTKRMTSQFSSQLESIISAPLSLTKFVTNSHDAMLKMKRSTRTNPLLSLVAKVILSNLSLPDLQPLTRYDLSLTLIVDN